MRLGGFRCGCLQSRDRKPEPIEALLDATLVPPTSMETCPRCSGVQQITSVSANYLVMFIYLVLLFFLWLKALGPLTGSCVRLSWKPSSLRRDLTFAFSSATVQRLLFQSRRRDEKEGTHRASAATDLSLSAMTQSSLL